MRILAVAIALGLADLAAAGRVSEPDYAAWGAILQKYYDPVRGMDYAALKARDAATLQNLRKRLGRINPGSLDRNQQLAYWINVYNINTVATIVENYPVASIRDISTDPIVRLNVFKKKRVPVGSSLLSLDEVENVRIRERFKDPRIHFAINCAARSCPPIRTEPYTGARVDAQLDDQVRRFFAGPLGARFGKKGGTLIIHVSKIMDWFGDDFETWGGGRIAFIRRYVTPERQRLIDQSSGSIDLAFDDYDWTLNSQR